MTNLPQSQKGFTIGDLLNKPDLVLETMGGYCDDEEDDRQFSFSNNPNLTNSEMLKFLNLDNEDDHSDIEISPDVADAIPFGMSFETQKLSMYDISGDGKVLKSVKRKGVGDVVPNNALVCVHYMGYFEYQDEPFDSSFLRRSEERIRLNQGSLIPGLDLAIQSMRKHEISHFLIHPDYAYGKLGCPPRIQPNQEVMFAVHLTDYLDNAAANSWETLNRQEKKCFGTAFPMVLAMHVTANDDYNRNRIRQAVKGYSKVVAILKDLALENDEEEKQQQKALSKALTNLAVCYNRLNLPRKACLSCQDVPIPTAKTHYHYGKALLTMSEYDNAMDELTRAKMLQPGDTNIIREIQLLNEKLRVYKQEERRLWSRYWEENRDGKNNGQYVECAREICKNFADDKLLLKQALPPGLKDDEIKCFQHEAAILGLSLTKQERRGKNTFYLSKPQY